jgi:hypothetical protein
MGRAELPRQNVPANDFADHPADRAMRAASRKDVQFHDRTPHLKPREAIEVAYL